MSPAIIAIRPMPGVAKPCESHAASAVMHRPECGNSEHLGKQ